MELREAVAHLGQRRGKPIQEVVAQDGQGAEHHLDQERAVSRGFHQHPPDPGFEVPRAVVHLVHPGAGIWQPRDPRFQACHARRQVSHQLPRLGTPIGSRAPRLLRDYLLQARTRFGVDVDVRLRQCSDRGRDLHLGQRRDGKGWERRRWTAVLERYHRSIASPGICSAPAATSIEEPAKSSPTDSCRPPRQRARNASATARNERVFSGRAKPWPSSGYSR